MLGHLPYTETNAADLVDVGSYRQSGRVVKLCRPARDSFLKMSAAARADHIVLIPISGFREIAYQGSLFQKAIEHYGTEVAAARWVAPPGFSEHHTGLALDIGDGATPDTDVETQFETTAASQWLLENASRFGFELSFPKENGQSVAYEPWHWRFVGDSESRGKFERARIQLQTIP